MSTLPSPQPLAELPVRLESLLDLPVKLTKAHGMADRGWDAKLEAGGWRFLVEARPQGTPLAVRSAIAQIRSYSTTEGAEGIPLLVVPFMGEQGAEVCHEAGISWMDLSGNASIKGPALRIHVVGKPNRYQRKGRSSNLFAPQASRLARWMLIHPGEPFSQQALGHHLGLDPGYLSRLIKRMCAEGLLQKDGSGNIRVDDPNLLLEAWRDGYHMQERERISGHILARSGEQALEQLAKRLNAMGVRYAATGLAAAWVHTRFAGFRLVSLYLDPTPSVDLAKELGMEETERGANLWLIQPKDEGVFHGANRVDQVQVVHPVQAYLDLKDHPERAPEAAQNLREHFMSWGRRA